MASTHRRHLLGLCLPPLLFWLLNVAFVLAAQPREYWSEGFVYSSHDFPTFRYLLQLHPLAYLASELVVAATFTTVLFMLPEMLAIIGCIAVVFGYTAGSATWLLYQFHLGYVVCLGLLLVSASVLGLSLRWVLAKPAGADQITSRRRFPWIARIAWFALLGGAAFSLYRLARPEAQYAWLVFGPDGKVQVLVCLEGEAVSLEHYFEGKSTGHKSQYDDRRDVKYVTLPTADEKTAYFISSISGKIAELRVPTDLFVHVDIQGSAVYRQYGSLQMSADLQTAPTAHFHGPLRIVARKTLGLTLLRGDKPTDFRACVSTIDEEKGCWVAVDNGRTLFSESVRPIADVEFPPKKLDEPPVKRRYPLNRMC